ncbi:C-type lectin domain family 4 member A-like [Talpa occidentalis]|uniref:C-type lectin domain family 4 member A-like n=1 Tax=Talpa occidentalis TaxID=50954 RepID=UPI0018905D0F|nr:C-type lectin domain family 4 member A-like [Talpa occidentalis]
MCDRKYKSPPYLVILRKKRKGSFVESRSFLLKMTTEITYAEVTFKNESKSSGTKSEAPRATPTEKTSPHKSNPGITKLLVASLLIFMLLAISFLAAFIFFFQKYSDLKGKMSAKEVSHKNLECTKENLTMEEKAWSCCPKNWKSHGSNCYFIASEEKNWMESEKNCSAMQAHLLVVTTKEEQDFIISTVNSKYAYYVGLSDPEGKYQWQWVDCTPYNHSATFWHQGEPNNLKNHCVILLKPRERNKWGWNNVNCHENHMSVCKMTKIYI